VERTSANPAQSDPAHNDLANLLRISISPWGARNFPGPIAASSHGNVKSKKPFLLQANGLEIRTDIGAINAATSVTSC